MVKGYSRTQIALHWVVLALVVFQQLYGESMKRVWFHARQTGQVDMTTSAWLHIIVGVAILVLMLWRLWLRLTRGVPALPDQHGPLVKLAGELAHWAFYVLLIAIPVSGLLAWYGGISSLFLWHSFFLRGMLYLLIMVHVAAAFWHQFIVGDGLLNRMRKPAD